VLRKHRGWCYANIGAGATLNFLKTALAVTYKTFFYPYPFLSLLFNPLTILLIPCGAITRKKKEETDFLISLADFFE
jgi:hypothetical protein